MRSSIASVCLLPSMMVGGLLVGRSPATAQSLGRLASPPSRDALASALGSAAFRQPIT